MNRRTFVKLLAPPVAGITSLPPRSGIDSEDQDHQGPGLETDGGISYAPPNPNPLFNQSDLVVTVGNW